MSKHSAAQRPLVRNVPTARHAERQLPGNTGRLAEELASPLSPAADPANRLTDRYRH